VKKPGFLLTINVNLHFSVTDDISDIPQRRLLLAWLFSAIVLIIFIGYLLVVTLVVRLWWPYAFFFERPRYTGLG
jgi:hypothetical protein